MINISTRSVTGSAGHAPRLSHPLTIVNNWTCPHFFPFLPPHFFRREPLTSVDTEHGFCGNLKASLAGFPRIFRA
jgi:hypothetical protein